MGTVTAFDEGIDTLTLAGPGLAPKSRCLLTLGFDVIPLGRLKAVGKEATSFRGDARDLVENLKAVRKGNRKAVDKAALKGLEALGSTYNLLTDPYEAVKLVASSNLVIRGRGRRAGRFGRCPPLGPILPR
ncbi:hypothetical protein AB0L40_26745 [Patulibacter sp. NPDC049589]|uniref:hypothetical protein n=1 Tax=Patulibacter sp. NPDC049589 TaxID=3154731 RepID=UPI003431122A